MDYDQRVEKIRAQNQPLLDAFQRWLERSGLSKKTVRNHVLNVDFFTEYLVYYEPLELLLAAESHDFLSFSLDWFPRKAMWASAGNARANIASFNKFAQFMMEAGHWSPAKSAEIKAELKANRADMIEAAEF